VGATVKAAVAKAGHDYMRAAYGEAVWDSVLEMLPAEDSALVRTIDTVAHFPVAADGRVFAALVHVRFGDDRSVAEAQLRQGGASQADAMLDGLFSIFARFVSPQQAFARAGSIITSVYSDGVGSSTEIVPGGKGGAIHILGLGESSFVSPWQCGWIERAVERFGGRDPRVTERSWEAGLDASPELVYDVRWE
jgi:hypothetical protein